MDFARYIDAHTLMFGPVGTHCAKESIRAVQLLWPTRIGEMVPIRLTPVAPHGSRRALSGTDGALATTAGGIVNDGITLSLMPAYWGTHESRAEGLLDDISNVIVHEYIHRMNPGAKHDTALWADECARIFQRAKVRVRVERWRKLTLADGSRVGGTPAGSLDYDCLAAFPAPLTVNILDRVADQTTLWMDMPTSALSRLEVTQRKAGRPKAAA